MKVSLELFKLKLKCEYLKKHYKTKNFAVLNKLSKKDESKL